MLIAQNRDYHMIKPRPWKAAEQQKPRTVRLWSKELEYERRCALPVFHAGKSSVYNRQFIHNLIKVLFALITFLKV